MARGFLRTVEEGASTQVYAATHPDAAKESGCFFAACKLVELEHDHLLANRTLAHELWQVAEDMLQQMQTAQRNKIARPITPQQDSFPPLVDLGKHPSRSGQSILG